LSGDDREDRPRLSWREIDQRRSGAHGRRDEPRGRAAKRESAQQKDLALKAADSLFSSELGGKQGETLAKAMRDAHGSAEFGDACRAYANEIGTPTDPALLSLFLDSGDPALIVSALEALLDQKNDGSLEISSGLKSQLRILEQDRDDTVAGICEDLLEGA
jgi:hypothetical protein